MAPSVYTVGLAVFRAAEITPEEPRQPTCASSLHDQLPTIG
jgi:hypothetical protein